MSLKRSDSLNELTRNLYKKSDERYKITIKGINISFRTRILK